MKFKLRKRTKLIVIAILVLLMITFSVVAYFQKDKMNVVEEDQVILEYTLTPEINSQFYLMENSIYDQIFLEDTDVIISKLLNHIYTETSFLLESKDADYMELSITQYEMLETYFGEDEHVMWRKTTEPVRETLMGIDNITFNQKEEFSPNEFKHFLNNAYETLEISPKAIVQIVWDINGTVVRGSDVLEINHRYTLPIPILDQMYIIDKENLVALNDEIVETIVHKTPANPIIFNVLAVLAGICLISLLVVVFAVKIKDEPTEYEKMKNKIFNDYGDRLAELEGSVYNTLSNMITVVKIEDLIKISDEIRQPVFYHLAETENEKEAEFFVFDESRIYHLVYFDKSEMTFETFLNEAV